MAESKVTVEPKIHVSFSQEELGVVLTALRQNLGSEHSGITDFERDCRLLSASLNKSFQLSKKYRGEVTQ